MTTAYDKDFFASQSDGSLASARAILPEIFSLRKPASLIDIGCGVGPWLQAAQELGVPSILGLDGTYVDRSQLLVDEDRFEVCDLEHDDLGTAVLGRTPFDIALCMEVAEHLSEARATTFVSQLCELSDVIVFSAAIPGQGGTNHINEQWPTYWANIFALHNFECFDLLRPKLWNKKECEWWYLQNILLFIRRSSDLHKIASFDAKPTTAPLHLIHPGCLDQKQSEFLQHTAELSQLLTYQPFGRDDAIRLLEGRIQELRTLAQQATADVETLQTKAVSAEHAHKKHVSELEEHVSKLEENLKQKGLVLQAMRNSTSWRLTSPLRALKNFRLQSDA